MKPVTACVTVPNDREQVYRHLDVLAGHEAFTDHRLVDWQCSGPRGHAARQPAVAGPLAAQLNPTTKENR